MPDCLYKFTKEYRKKNELIPNIYIKLFSY